MQRRSGITALLALAGLALGTGAVAADKYPSKPVKIVVGFQAGGPTDVVARLVAKALQYELKGAFVVENKPGATSNIASETVAAAQPDGYTLLLAAAPLTSVVSTDKVYAYFDADERVFLKYSQLARQGQIGRAHV